ncbi:phosphoglycolate phosphatase [Denitrificimonas caeni]|uniref:Phosphoglycolate phosphatase n=2 Tax=Denitrificimonas caeni TaxID=521720 RepID=A0AAF0ALL0_9GAMM|nr:phosphoglycolate phosphatase [Denitrificimonas caeni]WBE26531.1 phosphoglycolate phosphatase [Denitrificimonas caeni]
MFDLDGTLIDSVPDLTVATDQMLVQLGRAPAGMDKVRNWVGNGAPMLVRRALADGFAEQHISAEQEAQALAIFMQVYGTGNSLTTLYPGALETLQSLKMLGVKLALITNKPEKFIPELLAEMQIAEYFEWVVGGDTLPQKKPDPAGLLWVMQQAGVTAEQCLFVGDSRNDVQAARSAGVACIAVTYGYNYGEPISAENPALVLEDLRELFL